MLPLSSNDISYIFAFVKGERQAEKTRHRMVAKIKEAQLKKAAARLESEKRKESRRNKIASRKTDDNQHFRLIRSTTVPTPAVEITSFKRSHSHSYSEDHEIPISPPVMLMDELKTPISSNKHMVSG